MYDIRWIRENADQFDKGLVSRGLEPLSKDLLALDDRRRAAISLAQSVQEKRNVFSKEIGQAIANKDTGRTEALKLEVARLKETLTASEYQEKQLIAALDAALSTIANTPLGSVPVGRDEHENVVRSVWGQPRDFSFPPNQHFEIGENLGLMDFETAAKMSGARFVINKGALARLERALGQFMLDLHTSVHGYQEVNPPILVKDHAMFGTGQLPKFADDLFRVLPDYWLIPTAEVSLTNMVRDNILDEAALPLRLTALTPCFRAEAGAAGRDPRGMIRQHQFSKVELVTIASPEQSEAEHDYMTRSAERVLQDLELP